MDTNLTRTIDAFLAAYADPDGARRSAAVQRLWTEDGELVDPPLAARGHAGIVAQGETLLGQFPGHRFERSTGVDAHHGHARYGWRLVAPGGATVLEGCDHAEIDDQGRLRRVVGFFGALPDLA